MCYFTAFSSHPHITTNLILKRIDPHEGSTKEAQHLL